MDKVTISMGLANEVLGYLGKKPYEEVFQIIDKFQKEHQASVQAANEPVSDAVIVDSPQE